MIARVLLGSALVVGGCALLRLSLLAQFDRAATPLYPFPSPPVVPAATAPADSVARRAPPAASDRPAASAAASAPAAAASASASAATSATPHAPGAEVFHFASGQVVPTKEDLARLVAYANRVRRYEKIKVTLETYADAPGADAASELLAKRRGLIVRQTLLQLGFAQERIVNATADVATAPELAGCLKLTTTPPFEEAER
jgi:outer membrane protein OmpA-like peptidoglycan-associated protein